MNTTPTGVLFVTDKNLGNHQDCNVVDRDRRLLFEAANVVDQGTFNQVSKHPICVRPSLHDLNSQDVRAELFRLFPEEEIHRLSDVVDCAKNALAATCDSLRFKSDMKISRVVNSVSQIVHEAGRNLQAMIVALTLRPPHKDRDVADRLLNHSSQLCSLGVLIAMMSGLKKRTVLEIGVAGLLHDLSLVLRAESFDPSQCKKNYELREEFRKHPLVTMELLRSIPGLSSESMMMVSQIHEQCDGSGYPEGLNSERILLGAKILNIADAYLSLVRPLKGQSMVSSDALAYLCHHAARGKFDRAILKLFVKHMSMYPMGSVVELDDRTAAIVVRNNPLAPLSPVVSMHGKVVNLEAEKRTIEKVATNGLVNGRRVSKRRINEVFWRLDA